MGGALQESDRILGEIVFGVGDGIAGCLQKGQQEGGENGTGEPTPAQWCGGRGTGVGGGGSGGRSVSARRTQRCSAATTTRRHCDPPRAANSAPSPSRRRTPRSRR